MPGPLSVRALPLAAAAASGTDPKTGTMNTVVDRRLQPDCSLKQFKLEIRCRPNTDAAHPG